MTRQDIRRQARLARQQLTHHQQQQAAWGLRDQFCTGLAYLQAQHIGVYLSFDSEINTAPLIERLWQDNKTVYLPVLPTYGRHLRFQQFTPSTELRKNKFGIWEPIATVRKKAFALDIVGLPLVAFDQQGNRMGMGGGYYDATFALNARCGLGPRLIGFAHEVQRVAALPVQAWDVPLDQIITGKRRYRR